MIVVYPPATWKSSKRREEIEEDSERMWNNEAKDSIESALDSCMCLNRSMYSAKQPASMTARNVLILETRSRYVKQLLVRCSVVNHS